MERGFLIKRMWYLRFIDQKALDITGMTRDGLFYVEDGKIKNACLHMRFNDSPLKYLQNVQGLSECQRAGDGNYLPAIWSKQFAFHSVTGF